MKKLLVVLMLAAGFVVSALAQDAASTPVWDHGDNVSDITYRSVVIYRVYNQQDAYIVQYAKEGNAIGTVTIPKKWALQGQGYTRKLFFREKDKGLPSYMTVFYKNGEFYKAILTLSYNRSDAIWAVAPNGMQVNADVDTLNIEY
ncbi:MAG: hypothetical protein II187_01930 [Treponema sp.]|jgi:hypothetical protein|nr:hypothetical protein [Treponema sp.]